MRAYRGARGALSSPLAIVFFAGLVVKLGGVRAGQGIAFAKPLYQVAVAAAARAERTEIGMRRLLA